MKPFFGLPGTVKFCKRCVISNQRPSSTIEFKHSGEEVKKTIEFDEDGVCSACRFHETKMAKIDWNKREDDLLELLEPHRSNTGNYDVIVPGSGGKDSAFTAHVLKYKYGMNPLTVTWAPHLYTDIGWENFQNWMHVGGLDNILFTPNGRVHRVLTMLAFKNILHPFQPFIVGQRKIGPDFANKFGINLIMYGENQAEYGNKIEDNSSPKMGSEFYSSPSLDDILLGGEKISKIMEDHNFSLNDFKPYLPMHNSEATLNELEVHYLGYYLFWDPQECYYYSVENTGFKANSERTEGSFSKYSGIDDKVDPFHYYTTLIKFGLGRASYDAAQEIRNEKISREEGARLVQKFDSEFPKKYFSEFLDYISMTEEDFYNVIDSFRSPHLWTKKDNAWHLKHTVFSND